MQFLRGRYRDKVSTIRFEEHGNLGALLLPAGTYKATTQHGKHGRVTHVEDGNVQHALVRQDPLAVQIRMKPSDIKTHILDILHAIREAAAR